MTAPFVLMSKFKLKTDVALEAYEDWVKGLIEHVESKEPRLIAFHSFANAEGTEVLGLQVHPDFSSMEFHLQIMREYMKTAYADFLEASDFVVICGGGETAHEVIQKTLPEGTPTTVIPTYIGGFTRSSAAE